MITFSNPIQVMMSRLRDFEVIYNKMSQDLNLKRKIEKAGLSKLQHSKHAKLRPIKNSACKLFGSLDTINAYQTGLPTRETRVCRADKIVVRINCHVVAVLTLNPLLDRQ